MPDAGQALLSISPPLHQFWAAQGDFDPKPVVGAVGRAGFLFTVTNISGVATALGWDFGGKDPGNFQFVNDTCDTVLAPGEQCELWVQFNAPTDDTSTRSATVVVTDDGGGVATADLIGHVTVSSGFLRLEPAMHDYGNPTQGSAQFTFTVRNTSNPDQSGSVTFDSIQFSIDQTGSNFGFTESSTCFGPLGPGGTCTIGIFFQTGQSLGPKSGILKAHGTGNAPGDATSQMFGGSNTQI
jgi:hypothetical protein